MTGILLGQFRQQARHLFAIADLRDQGVDFERFGRREQDRFDHAQQMIARSFVERLFGRLLRLRLLGRAFGGFFAGVRVAVVLVAFFQIGVFEIGVFRKLDVFTALDFEFEFGFVVVVRQFFFVFGVFARISHHSSSRFFASSRASSSASGRSAERR